MDSGTKVRNYVSIKGHVINRWLFTHSHDLNDFDVIADTNSTFFVSADTISTARQDVARVALLQEHVGV